LHIGYVARNQLRAAAFVSDAREVENPIGFGIGYIDKPASDTGADPLAFRCMNCDYRANSHEDDREYAASIQNNFAFDPTSGCSGRFHPS
jgi:hypothetical protein